MKERIAFFGLAMSLCVAAGLGAQEASIRSVTGKVEYQSPGGSWKPAVAGTKLDANAVISTAFKSTAVVALGNSTLTVKPLTRLTLEEIARREGSDSVSLYLLAGRVKAEVKAPTGSKVQFKIKSPTATASVRGTSWDFDGINTTVLNGQVYLEGTGGGPGVLVGEGEVSFVDENGNASAPVSFAALAAGMPDLPAGIDQSLIDAILAGVPGLAELIGSVNVTVNW